MVVDATQISVRVIFSLQHIRAAALFARSCHAVENAFANAWVEARDIEDQAYATSSVISAVGFLEATINELLERSVSQPGSLAPLTEGQILRLSVFRKEFVRKNSSPSTLNSYQLALACVTDGLMDQGAQPFQDANLLIAFRNAIIHYDQGNVVVSDSEKPVEMQKIAAQLQGKFTPNPYAVAAGHNWFPSRFLGHGCSAWAVATVIAFADEFFGRVGLPIPYEHIRAELTTEA